MTYLCSFRISQPAGLSTREVRSTGLVVTWNSMLRFDVDVDVALCFSTSAFSEPVH